MGSSIVNARIGAYIRSRGERLLSHISHKTGMEVRGEIRTTSDPSRRYAFVHKDPDILFVEPGHDYTPLPPRYDIWVGENLQQSVRALKAFDFTIAHEAMHVVGDIGTLGLKRIFRFPEKILDPLEDEVIMDRAALEIFQNDRSLINSMAAFSELVILDYAEGGLKKLAIPNAARELAKLQWIEQEARLPQDLKERSRRITESYFKAMAEHDHGQLKEKAASYYQLFSSVKVEISCI